MSPQMKLDDKPNKIGRKKWKLVFDVFSYSAPNLYTGKIYFPYLLQSLKRGRHWCFCKSMSRILTEDHGYCH